LTGFESSGPTRRGTKKLLLLAFLVRQKDAISMAMAAMVLRGYLVLCSTSQVEHLVDSEDAAVGMLLLTHHGCRMMEVATACVS
jgi:hypothetical protein